VLHGDAALFAAVEHPKLRENYYFVFYSERLDAMWIMSSKQFHRGKPYKTKPGKMPVGGPSALTVKRKALNTPRRVTSNIVRMTSRSFGRSPSWLSNLKSV
jgi:hypothetical protein